MNSNLNRIAWLVIESGVIGLLVSFVYVFATR